MWTSDNTLIVALPRRSGATRERITTDIPNADPTLEAERLERKGRVAQRKTARDQAYSLFKGKSEVEWSRAFIAIDKGRGLIRKRYGGTAPRERLSDRYLEELLKILDLYGRNFLRFVINLASQDAYVAILDDVWHDLWIDFSLISAEDLPNAPTFPSAARGPSSTDEIQESSTLLGSERA